MSAILDVRHLVTQIPTPRGRLTVVDDVSFTIEPGECFGLVGESGSGKSMTCRSILGLVPAPGKAVEGTIAFDDRNLRLLDEGDLNRIRGKQIAMIVQDAISALNPVISIGEQVIESMLQHNVVSNRTEGRQKAADLLRRVGIAEPDSRLDDYPHQFSGGMCQRVVIAIALSCSPRLLLADEPTTALDVTIQDQILKLLVGLQKDLGLSVLLVTHDMGVAAETCQRVGVMYAGQLVEIASTVELFAQPRHPYTLALLRCAPGISEGADVAARLPIPGAPPDLYDPPEGCRFAPRCPFAIDACRSGTFPLKEIAPGRYSACIRQAELEEAAPAESLVAGSRAAENIGGPPLIEVRHLSKRYAVNKGIFRGLLGQPKQQLVALDDVSFDIAPGEIVSIVGESGSGKTTLGRAMLRLIEASSGEVLYQGRDLLASSAGEMLTARRELQMIFQDPYSSLNPRLSVRDTLGEVLRVHNMVPPHQVESRCVELLDLVGLPPDAMKRFPHQFSGGQRQRLGIARALAVEPKFIVADEPVSAVDVSVQSQIMNLLIDLRERLGLTMLFISHDLSVVQYVSSRVGVMYMGRLVELAPTRSLFGSARHPYTRGLLRAAPKPDPSRPRVAVAIAGEPPSPLRLPPGCHFQSRCPLATDVCRSVPPPFAAVEPNHFVACHHHAAEAPSLSLHP